MHTYEQLKYMQYKLSSEEGQDQKNLQKRGLAAAQCSTTILPIYIAIEGEMGTFLQLVRVTNTSSSHLQFGAGSNNPILQLTHGLYRSFFLECSI